MPVTTGQSTGVVDARILREDREQRGGFVSTGRRQRSKGSHPSQQELNEALAKFKDDRKNADLSESEAHRHQRGARAHTQAPQAAGTKAHQASAPATSAAAAAPVSPALSSVQSITKETSMNNATASAAPFAQTPAAAAAHTLGAQAAAPAAPAAPAAAPAAPAATATQAAQVAAQVAVAAAPVVNKTAEQRTLELRALATTASATASAQASARMEAAVAAAQAESEQKLQGLEMESSMPDIKQFTDLFAQALNGGDPAAAGAAVVHEVVALTAGTAMKAMAQSISPLMAMQRAVNSEMISIQGTQAAQGALLEGTIARVEALEKTQGVIAPAAVKTEESFVDATLGHIKTIGAYAGFGLGMAALFRVGMDLLDNRNNT